MEDFSTFCPLPCFSDVCRMPVRSLVMAHREGRNQPDKLRTPQIPTGLAKHGIVYFLYSNLAWNTREMPIAAKFSGGGLYSTVGILIIDQNDTYRDQTDTPAGPSQFGTTAPSTQAALHRRWLAHPGTGTTEIPTKNHV